MIRRTPPIIGYFVLMLALSGCTAPTDSAVGRRGWRHGEGLAELRLPPSSDQIRPDHPRLLVTTEDIVRVRALSKTDPTAAAFYRQVAAYADSMLGKPPMTWSAKNHIGCAREVLQRVTHLGAMFRLVGNRAYADRARTELLAAAAFPDWDPADFLTTAEMTAAMSIGFDWVYDALSETDRRTITQAIVVNGLTPGLQAYESGASWTAAHHNWNLVCNGGLFLGALAVYEHDPAIAKRVIAQSRASIRNGFASYAPDGGCEEGPTYWNYATRYACFYLSSLQTAMGVKLDPAGLPGFPQTGNFRIHTLGPTGKPFNFGDSSDLPGISPQMFWLARTFDRPAYAAFERMLASTTNPGVLDLLWYLPGDNDVLTKLPNAATFHGVDVAAFRGSWEPAATYIAFKGGSAKAHHGHLDLGSFVLDALGQRWALDLGPDDYDLPGYASESQRFTYYRTSSRGHNTLTINDRNQSLSGEAPIVSFYHSPARSHAVVDLTSAFEPEGRKVMRGVALIDGRDVLIEDEINLRSEARVAWTMHTGAKVAINGASATLMQNGQTLSARILSPPGARFEVGNANPPPPQAQQPDVHRLMIVLEVNQPTRICVQFTPAGYPPANIRIDPLARWADYEELAAPQKPPRPAAKEPVYPHYPRPIPIPPPLPRRHP